MIAWKASTKQVVHGILKLNLQQFYSSNNLGCTNNSKRLEESKEEVESKVGQMKVKGNVKGEQKENKNQILCACMLNYHWVIPSFLGLETKIMF